MIEEFEKVRGADGRHDGDARAGDRFVDEEPPDGGREHAEFVELAEPVADLEHEETHHGGYQARGRRLSRVLVLKV